LPKQQQKEKELTVDEVKKMIYKLIEKKQKQINQTWSHDWTNLWQICEYRSERYHTQLSG